MDRATWIVVCRVLVALKGAEVTGMIMVRRTWMVGLLAPALLVAADWPQFRGPNAAGVSDDTGLPVEFAPNKNVIWKTVLPPGHSSPAIAGNRLFITAYEGDKLLTLCLERATGTILWRRDVPAMRAERLNKLNDRASPTPVTDGKNVYAFFGDFGLVSYGPDGNERWRMPLGPFTNLHGMAASPVLVDGRIVQLCDQDNNAYLLAINKDDGRVVWKTERAEVTHGFSTPVVYRPSAGPPQLIVPGSYQLIVYRADTGEKLWWVRGTTWQVKSAPVIGGDTLYFTGWAPGGDAGEQLALPPFEEVIPKYDSNHDGKIAQSEIPKEWWPPTWSTIDLDKDGLLNWREWSFYRARRASENNLMAVRLGGKGDVTETHVLWRFRKSLPDVPCPLLYRGVLYLVRTGGIATSLNPATGEVYKQARLAGALEDYYSSPVGADGKVYMASQAGKVLVLKATPVWEILAVNDLQDEIYATPAIVDRRIYVRTNGTLYCFGS